MTVTTEITIDFTDLDSMAEAIGLGITTPEQLAQHIGCELDEDGVLVLEDCPMYADLEFKPDGFAYGTHWGNKL